MIVVVLLNCLRFSWAWHQQHPARPQEWWCKQRKGSSDQCKALKIGCVPNVFPRTLSRRNKAILHWRVSQFHSEQFCRRVYEKGINYSFPYLIKTISSFWRLYLLYFAKSEHLSAYLDLGFQYNLLLWGDYIHISKWISPRPCC